MSVFAIVGAMRKPPNHCRKGLTFREPLHVFLLRIPVPESFACQLAVACDYRDSATLSIEVTLNCVPGYDSPHS